MGGIAALRDVGETLVQIQLIAPLAAKPAGEAAGLVRVGASGAGL